MKQLNDIFPATAPNAIDALRENWKRIRAEQPRIRIRDAAARLGVSEAELLVTEEWSMRLVPDWKSLLSRFHDLGRVMALTRNEHCVIENTGRFGEPKFFQHGGGLVLGPEIDLRFFFSVWHFAFAIEQETAQGLRRSFQFFDPAGDAVFKLHLKDEADSELFHTLSHQFANVEETGPLIIERKAPEELPEQSPETVLENRDEFRAAWRGLRDTHDFHKLLRKFNLKREDALRLAGEEFAVELKSAAVDHALEIARNNGQPIMVFVGNRGMIQIFTGKIHRLVRSDEWLNVLDPSFNLHLRTTGVASAWLVRKPTVDGIVTSVECFDAGGGLVAQLFGQRKPGQPERDDWRKLTGILDTPEWKKK
ncbi:MAG: ChuX/HutX family heme-like substrate-binding protein [Opitutales bacterium]